MGHAVQYPRRDRARLLRWRLGRLRRDYGIPAEREEEPERDDERLSSHLDAADAPSRSAHGGHAGDGDAGERHRVFRLDFTACDRRLADRLALTRGNAERARDAPV